MLFTPLSHIKHRQTTQMHNKCNKGLCRTSVAILICLLASGVSRTNAVPTDSGSVVAVDVRPHLLQRASMMQEEPKDATASTETSMDQQGLCLSDGVLVAETTVFCEKKVGCRANIVSGHCCPDYKCDCQKDGKTYLNGDKLVDPETPCTVCYCQGGEILCSSVTCFHRDDCTPKYIQGRCCPEYDNCPVPASLPNSSSNQTVSSSVANTAKAPEVPALNPEITIKEITKPIEIRITDKGIPIHQMLKPSSTETPSTATTTTVKPTTSSTTSTTTTTTTAASMVESSTKPTPFSVDNNHNKNTLLPVGGINNESLKLSSSVAYPNQSKYQGTTVESSAEDFDEIVMVKNRNGDEKPISVFGSQGLQRVESESANDPSKVNIKREYFVTSEGAPPVNAVPAGFDDLRAPELIYSNGGEAGESAGLQQTSAELEPDTAGSDNIYHIILTTDGPRSSSTTEGFLDLKSTSSTEESTFDLHNDTVNFEMEAVPYSTTDSPMHSQASSQETSDATPSDESTTERLEETMKSLTTEGPEATSPESLKPTTEGLHHLEDDDIPIPMESNPAYPSLPEDDFSLRDVNFPLSETDDIGEVDLKDESRSIGSAFDTMKSTKHLDEQHNYMEGSGSGMLTDMDAASSSTTDGIMEASSTTELLARVPSKNIELMYSAEDSSEETSISNSTDFQLEKIMKEAESENGSGDSLEVENVESTLGSGSGSGELTMADKKYGKQREHTTPRPTKRPVELDIDELSGGASGDGNQSAIAEDPKLDVESLKLDESQDDSVTKPEVGVKANILSVKTNPGQDKTADEMPIGEIVRVAEEPESSVRVQRLYLQRVF